MSHIEHATRENHNILHWTDIEYSAVQQAESFHKLSETALIILDRLPKPLSQVCGPISTGGKGSIEENVQIFRKTMALLVQQKVNLFDQFAFHEHIFRIAQNKWTPQHNKQLLQDFYLPIFESRQVSTFYFISGWEGSEGASWEHRQAQRLGIDIKYLLRNPLQRESDLVG